MAKMYIGNDPKMMSVADEISKECEAATKDITERCDFGAKINECICKGLKSRKIDTDMF